VHGAHYPPPFFNQILSNLLYLTFLLGLLILFFGDRIFSFFQFPTQPLEYLKQNKLFFIVALFLLQAFATNLVTTGAFEISYNDVLVWSKLESGHLPNFELLTNALKQQGLLPAQPIGM